jgi:hypothetical protein
VKIRPGESVPPSFVQITTSGCRLLANLIGLYNKLLHWIRGMGATDAGVDLRRGERSGGAGVELRSGAARARDHGGGSGCYAVKHPT